jgi:uncharacterized membrane protein
MWAGIMSVFKALPAIVTLVNTFISMYNKWQDDKILKHYEQKKATRERILLEIAAEGKKPIGEIDENKVRELHRKLRNLDSID